jgi:hypothetical protein
MATFCSIKKVSKFLFDIFQILGSGKERFLLWKNIFCEGWLVVSILEPILKKKFGIKFCKLDHFIVVQYFSYYTETV